MHCLSTVSAVAWCWFPADFLQAPMMMLQKTCNLTFVVLPLPSMLIPGLTLQQIEGRQPLTHPHGIVKLNFSA